MAGGIRTRWAILAGWLVALAACENGGEVDRAARDALDVPEVAETEAGRAVLPPEERFPGALAVTIDDLPWVGALPPGESREDATRRLLDGLAEHDVVATGFVDCDRVQPGTPVLRLWLDAGMRLGNHGAAHLDLNEAAPSAWIAEARRCHAFIQELTGDSIVFFRYPYLHRGPTLERYTAARDAVAAMGAVVAPVTIDTSDWILAAAYGDAIRAGDEERAEAIGAALVEHVARQAAHYREVAREKFGRDIAHILLLHANALEADYIDEVLERVRAEGFRFVPLEEALQDPVYDRPDDYIGPEGLSWLYRMEPGTPEMRAWDDAEARRLREMFPR